jgi:ribonuclease HI
MITIYTDGSCIHNANVSGNANGPGGYASQMYLDQEIEPFHTITGGDSYTTNNRMEIAALLESLKYLDHNHLHHTLVIYSDSQYVINSINTWLTGWAKKNFRDIKNSELWKEVHNCIIKFPKVSGIWVKGHAGDPRNEEVNDLAQAEAYNRKG